MADQAAQAKRTRISVDVPPDVRWQLKQIAIDRRMFFKDYLQDVFAREVKRSAAKAQPASSS